MSLLRSVHLPGEPAAKAMPHLGEKNATLSRFITGSDQRAANCLSDRFLALLSRGRRKAIHISTEIAGYHRNQSIEHLSGERVLASHAVMTANQQKTHVSAACSQGNATDQQRTHAGVAALKADQQSTYKGRRYM